jgi:hypothetical protein
MVYLKMGLQQSSGMVRRLSVVVVSAIAVSLGSFASNISESSQAQSSAAAATLTSCRW